jgi:hypothetical protein
MMKNRRSILLFAGSLSLVGLSLGSLAAFADEKPKAAAKTAAPAGAPNQDEMMKAWMDPAKPPEESTGTAESKWALGGRFVEERVEGTAMGQPFTGIGYTGYDNYKKKYVGTWMDSVGTMIMNTSGTADSSGKKFTFWSTIDDVVMKKAAKVKGVATVVDGDHHTYEMWSPAPDGKMFKSLEIQYTRKK